MKERVRKLRTIQKGLGAKNATGLVKAASKTKIFSKPSNFRSTQSKVYPASSTMPYKVI